MPIYGLTPTSLPTWRMSNEMHGNPIGPIRSRGTKLSILIGSLAEGPGILRENVVRTSVTHSAAPHIPLFCSYHILTSSVIYY